MIARDRCRRFAVGEEPNRILVRGVIDRVDVDPRGGGRAIVRDYKSGSARPQHQVAHWREDRQLQVALYMLAVRELLGLRPVAGLYQPLGGGDLRARGIHLKDAPVGARVFANDARSEQDLDEELDDAAARALALAARLAGRRARAVPGDVLARRMPVPGHLLEPAMTAVGCGCPPIGGSPG